MTTLRYNFGSSNNQYECHAQMHNQSKYIPSWTTLCYCQLPLHTSSITRNKIPSPQKTENRARYAPHGLYGWYIFRASLQYRYFKYYMTRTKSKRASDIVDLIHHHFDMHKNSSVDAAAIEASQMIHDL